MEDIIKKIEITRWRFDELEEKLDFLFEKLELTKEYKDYQEELRKKKEKLMIENAKEFDKELGG